jgi:hypothetical protein
MILHLHHRIHEVPFPVVFQPVRTFFHTNKSTCGEWLTRIRSAVVIVAIHAGQATTAVRHGHCMLQDMADSNNTQVWKKTFCKHWPGWIYLCTHLISKTSVSHIECTSGKCKGQHFSLCHYLCNRSTLDICALGYIGIL